MNLPQPDHRFQPPRLWIASNRVESASMASFRIIKLYHNIRFIFFTYRFRLPRSDTQPLLPIHLQNGLTLERFPIHFPSLYFSLNVPHNRLRKLVLG